MPQILADTLCVLASLGATAADGRFLFPTFFFLIFGIGTGGMAFGGFLNAAAASAALVWSLLGTLACDTRPPPALENWSGATTHASTCRAEWRRVVRVGVPMGVCVCVHTAFELEPATPFSRPRPSVCSSLGAGTVSVAFGTASLAFRLSLVVGLETAR